MKSFDYVRPATVRDAVTAAAAPGAAYLAAGTNLLDLMKGGVTAPSRLVDLTHLSGLDRIEELLTARGHPVKRYRKRHFTHLAPLELKQQIKSECDLVVEGLAD